MRTTTAAARELRNLVGGAEPSGSGEPHEILCPADRRRLVSRYHDSTAQDVDQAVQAAQQAQMEWREEPVVRRCRILFHCKELLEQRADDLAKVLVEENGKTLAEALGELRRGIEVVEFAAGMPSLAKGDYIDNIAGNVDGYIYREPLGVVAGACPFNFPAMIPMWMFPVAIACGNSFILKPSEKCPTTGALTAELFLEGGLPEGVLNVVHGGRQTVEALLDHPGVRAFSFVGSTPVARAVWKRGTAAGKRVQALGGAKNYIVVMPDADPEQTVKAVLESTYGCCGERCMAASVLVLVGPRGPRGAAQQMLERVVEASRKVRIGDGLKPGTQMGPLITAEHRQRVLAYIEAGQQEGAKLILDGRSVEVDPELEHGNFIGPTIFDEVTPEMRIAREEIFGPVLSVMRADTLDAALKLLNSSTLGNGASIFTASGAAAQKFRKEAECGMIGINAGVPAPMAFFSFGGHKQSLFGDLRAHGPDGIEFYTQKKSIIERWMGATPTGSIWSR